MQILLTTHNILSVLPQLTWSFSNTILHNLYTIPLFYYTKSLKYYKKKKTNNSSTAATKSTTKYKTRFEKKHKKTQTQKLCIESKNSSYKKINTWRCWFDHGFNFSSCFVTSNEHCYYFFVAAVVVVDVVVVIANVVTSNRAKALHAHKPCHKHAPLHWLNNRCYNEIACLLLMHKHWQNTVMPI